MTLMKLKQFAEYAQLTPITAYRLAIAGKIPAVRVGSGWRIVKELFDKEFSNLLRRKR